MSQNSCFWAIFGRKWSFTLIFNIQFLAEQTFLPPLHSDFPDVKCHLREEMGKDIAKLTLEVF